MRRLCSRGIHALLLVPRIATGSSSGNSHFSPSWCGRVPFRELSCTAGLRRPPPDAPFEYDPMSNVSSDAAKEASRRKSESVVRSLLPPNAPPAAFTKALQYVLSHPVNELITTPLIQITHISNAAGEEEKVSLPPCELAEALKRAKDSGFELVAMGANAQVSFCRVQDMKKSLLLLVKKEMEAAAEADGAQPPSKQRSTITHQFRDVVDAHFIGWKSKKILDDLAKGHPVKLVIKEFQSWDGALLKLQAMCTAMQKSAEARKLVHHFTSITANATEASVIFAPPARGRSGTLRYPGAKEWGAARKRMEDACQKSGRQGTYMKTSQMKPRSLGETTYRVDKYGRRI